MTSQDGLRRLHPRLVVVTASAAPEKMAPYWPSWIEKARGPLGVVMHLDGLGIEASWVPDGPLVDAEVYFSVTEPTERLGVVRGFAAAVRDALEIFPDAEYFACLHDDLRIDLPAWDERVVEFFDQHPKVGLAGFGGALGVGREGMYEEPYDPMTLARHGFLSNMEQAEAHGSRWRHPRPVAVLDGFSMIFRRDLARATWDWLAGSGIRHHVYDVAAACLARRLEQEVWLLPVRCHHAGGQTAVGDASYQEWARTVHERGDQGFWEEAHRVVWEEFKDVLPIRVD